MKDRKKISSNSTSKNIRQEKKRYKNKKVFYKNMNLYH